jgi:hypothetical protein
MSASAELRRELDTALAGLERWVLGRKKPTRHQARAVLVALGAWIEAERPAEEAVQAVRARIERGVAPLAEAWEAAVLDELILACTEHVRSVDPRHLTHPRYDLEYTVHARERLEARLVAASALGASPSEELLDRVARADEILRAHLERRARQDPPEADPDPGREPP